MNAKNIGTVAIALLVAVAAMGFAHESGLPADGDTAKQHLIASPRHGEWASYDAGDGDMVDAWVVYPERPDAAPVVIVIHEIFGLSDWARAVADQFAAEGFIAVAPDFLSGKGPGGKGSSSVDSDAVRGLIRGLDAAELTRRLDGAAKFATGLPAATDEYGIVGYCWGGGVSFSYATQQPGLGAAVVYYGTSPKTETLADVQAPVLGLYGGSDNRVNATIPAAEAEMKRLGKTYEVEILDGAGHGFLRQQTGRDGANMAATEKAWPRTIEFFRQALEVKQTSQAAKAQAILAAYTGSDDEIDCCEILGDSLIDSKLTGAVTYAD